MDDMKEALDKAASSADQAVRNMALRYREMQQEFTQYEAFFAIYKQGVGINGSATAARPPVKGRTPVAKVTTPAQPRADRTDSFSVAMQTILTEHGQPMKLNELHAAYQARTPDDPTSSNTFRQRLIKRRGMVVLIEKRGWWWADAPLVDNAEGEPNG